MDKKSKDLAVSLLEAWAASKGSGAGKPVVCAGARSYSADDYVNEVRNETEFGKGFLDFLEASAKRTNKPLDEFIKQAIRPDPPRP